MRVYQYVMSKFRCVQKRQNCIFSDFWTVTNTWHWTAFSIDKSWQSGKLSGLFIRCKIEVCLKCITNNTHVNTNNVYSSILILLTSLHWSFSSYRKINVTGLVKKQKNWRENVDPREPSLSHVGPSGAQRRTCGSFYEHRHKWSQLRRIATSQMRRIATSQKKRRCDVLWRQFCDAVATSCDVLWRHNVEGVSSCNKTALHSLHKMPPII